MIAFIAISFSFVLFRALPGDAVTNMSRVPNMTKEAQAALRAQFGIDKPLATQYLLYLKQLARGNLGRLLQNQQPVLRRRAARGPQHLPWSASAPSSPSSSARSSASPPPTGRAAPATASSPARR